MIYVICTFFIALILQCTTREFVFIAGYKMSHSAWRSIHWMSLSFTLSDSEGSIFLLIQDLPKLEQGEEFSRIMEGELDSTSKLEIYKTAIAFCTWPSKSVYHCGVALHTTSAHTLIFTSGVKLGSTHRVSVWTANPQQWPQQWPETAHAPFWSSVCWQTRLLSREHICSLLLPPADRRTSAWVWNLP